MSLAKCIPDKPSLAFPLSARTHDDLPHHTSHTKCSHLHAELVVHVVRHVDLGLADGDHVVFAAAAAGDLHLE